MPFQRGLAGGGRKRSPTSMGGWWSFSCADAIMGSWILASEHKSSFSKWETAEGGHRFVRAATDQKARRPPTELPGGIVAHSLTAIRQLGRGENILDARWHQHA